MFRPPSSFSPLLLMGIAAADQTFWVSGRDNVDNHVLSEYCTSFVFIVNLLLWAAAHLARTPPGAGRPLLSLQNTSGFRVK